MNENLLAFLILTAYFSPVLYQIFLAIKEYKIGNKRPLRRLRKFLKYSFIILIPILIIFFTLNRVNYLNYKKPITFDKINEISFEDFRGFEFFKKSLYGNERFAYIVTSIESDINDKNVTVQSFFHPARSYVYNTHAYSKELLSHELYHFKITELFVRKAKKKISELEKYNKEAVEDIILNVKIEMRDYQRSYDYDTFHSYVLREQKKYERTVDSLLHLLTEYKNPKISINE